MVTTQTPPAATPEPAPALPGEASSSSLRGRLNDVAAGRWRGSSQEGGSLVDQGYPTINLVSPHIIEAQAARKIMRRFGLALLVVLVIVAFGWWMARAQLSGAESDQTAAQAQFAQTQHALGGLTSITAIGANVDSNQQQIANQLQTEAYTSRVVKQFLGSIPHGVVINNYSLQMLALADLTAPVGGSQVNPANPCGSAPNPFEQSRKIGCIHFQGQALTYDQATHLVNYLTGTYLSQAYVGGVQHAQGGWTFSGSVAILPAALSGRYNQGAELRKSLINGTPPVQPSAAPSASANGQG